jgi:hypothetical protein
MNLSRILKGEQPDLTTVAPLTTSIIAETFSPEKSKIGHR